MSPNELKQNPILFEVKKDGTRPTGYRGLTFKELEQQGKQVGSTASNGYRESVITMKQQNFGMFKIKKMDKNYILLYGQLTHQEK